MGCFENFDAVVAGAGMWGCTVARTLSDFGKRVLVIDKRNAIGGNSRSEYQDGIEVHLYGSHIFHTSIKEVRDFITRFAQFNCYQHKVLAMHNGKAYFLPIGLALINKFFNASLTPNEVGDFMSVESNKEKLFDTFFKNYTLKQWGLGIKDIDKSIINRIPIRNNYNINYFNDCFQGIPIGGYGEMFDKMLKGDNITVLVNSELKLDDGDFIVNGECISNIPIFYSGAIDKLFGYCFGCLPWRTLDFETEKLEISDYQGNSVVNYVDSDVKYTRIHEFKHYHPENLKVMQSKNTIVVKEYPREWKVGDEPYYPVANKESSLLYEKYRKLSYNFPNLIVGGRLGEYKYYDMDKTIQSALKSVNSIYKVGAFGK